MKNILVSLALLCLTACIPVDDFGAYWNKGAVDSALAGTWKNVRKHKGETDFVQITVENGSYRIDSLSKGDRAQKDYAPLFARTLTAGKYTFFMATSGSGNKTDRNLVRYALKGKTLREYSLMDNRVTEFLKEKYPRARNIKGPQCADKCLFTPVKIKTLDGEAVKILSGIPDTPEYWKPMDAWRKVK